MEWMLQVVDEIDDAVGAARLCSLGLAADIGRSIAAGLGFAIIGAALWRGEPAVLMIAAAAMLSIAAARKIHGLPLQTPRASDR